MMAGTILIVAAGSFWLRRGAVLAGGVFSIFAAPSALSGDSGRRGHDICDKIRKCARRRNGLLHRPAVSAHRDVPAHAAVFPGGRIHESPHPRKPFPARERGKKMGIGIRGRRRIRAALLAGGDGRIYRKHRLSGHFVFPVLLFCRCNIFLWTLRNQQGSMIKRMSPITHTLFVTS